ncbi:hypothetical protein ACROYT_G016160 [Oculina patagonica]
MVKQIEECARQLGSACDKSPKKEVKIASSRMEEVINSLTVIGKMKTFEEENSQISELQVFRHYMQMVMEMTQFIRAVRTGDWQLHLTWLQVTWLYFFFAHDRKNYARMIPLCLAETSMLPESDPEIYEEFRKGNWAVNKNPDVPFCALGADHALEQINRSMKVSGGLVGITLNPNARTKFFLIAPELAHLAEDAKEMAGTTPAKEGTRHHTLSASVISREEKNVEQLITTMEDFAKSLYRAEQRSLQPCDKDWKNQSLVADEEKKAPDMEDHGEEIKVSSAGQIVELQEDRNLFARMMVICKS